MSPGAIEVDAAGYILDISEVMPGQGEDQLRLDGYVIPAMSSALSVSSRRALGCLYRLHPGDFPELKLSSFQREAIAAQLFIELIESGMTSVGERTTLEEAPSLRAAGQKAGIGLSLLLDTKGRDLADPEPLFADFKALSEPSHPSSLFDAGLLLRQPGLQPPAWMEAFRALDESAPVLIQPQKALNDAEIKALGPQSGFTGLLQPRFTKKQAALVAQSGLVVVSTPGQLQLDGDKQAPLASFVEAEGRLAIGSGPALSTQLSQLWAGLQLETHPGAALYPRIAQDSATAIGQPTGVLLPGFRADLLVLGQDHPRLFGLRPGEVLDAFLESGAPEMIDQVVVAGQRVVHGSRHVRRRAVFGEFKEAMRQVLRERA